MLVCNTYSYRNSPLWIPLSKTKGGESRGSLCPCNTDYGSFTKDLIKICLIETEHPAISESLVQREGKINKWHRAFKDEEKEEALDPQSALCYQLATSPTAAPLPWRFPLYIFLIWDMGSYNLCCPLSTNSLWICSIWGHKAKSFLLLWVSQIVMLNFQCFAEPGSGGPRL